MAPRKADRLYVHDSRSQCQTPADDYYFVDYLSGGKGNDKLYGDGYYVVMEGNKGNDLLNGCSRIDPVVAVYTHSANAVT
ncbi:MAG: hypothetical protein LC775_00895 [Acidobacteria bacterium]|nr:hypothetical protein [Acidobacteriota bacterium]